MRYVLLIVGMLLAFPCYVMADDYTQQQILNEMRDWRYEQQYQRTLDSWTNSIRRNNRQIQENFKRQDRQRGTYEGMYDNYGSDYESDAWYPDPDGGLVIGDGDYGGY